MKLGENCKTTTTKMPGVFFYLNLMQFLYIDQILTLIFKEFIMGREGCVSVKSYNMLMMEAWFTEL